jgi:hypothetical protein
MIPPGTSFALSDTKGMHISVKMKIALSPASILAAQDNPYLALGGPSGAVVDSETGVRQAKAVGGVAYEGLKAVVDGLYDCSDLFLPLKTAAGVFRTIIKHVEVCVLMYDTDSWVTHCLFLPIRLYWRTSRNSKTLKQS